MKLLLIMIGVLILSACETTETRIHNPNKPISEYDSDLYNCKMMAMQTNPEPARSNATNTRCHAIGNTLNCDQRPVDNQPIGAPFFEMQRKSKINAMTEECMARQGWRKEAIYATSDSQRQNNTTKKRNTQTYVKNRPIGSACIDDAQCIDGICDYVDGLDYKQCRTMGNHQKNVNLDKSQVNKSKLFNKDRSEGSACIADEQCIEDMKCTDSFVYKFKKCTRIR